MEDYDDEEFDNTLTDYPACKGCAHEGNNDGICDVPGACQAYPNAETWEDAPELAMLMLPPAVKADNGRLFA